MNERIISSLVTLAGISLLVLIVWLKENHKDILVAIFGIMLGLIILIGLINMVYEFIYEVLPALGG